MTTYIDGKAVGVGTIRAEIGVSGVVLHDDTLVGNGNTEPLGVNTANIVSQQTLANTISVLNTAIDAQAEAIQKTREDYIQADSEIHQMINGLSAETTTIKNNQASLGTQVANIEHKIPDGTTGTNPLINKQILAQTSYTKAEVDAKVSSVYKFKGSVSTYNSLPSTATTGDVYNVADTGANYAWDGSKWDKLSETIDLTAYATTEYVTAREQDIRSDLGENISEVHTQVVGLSGEVATGLSRKQDKLTAGDNITIEDGVISATGGGGDYLPLSGGTITGKLLIDVGESPTTVGAKNALGFTGTVDGAIKTCWFSYTPQDYILDVNNVNIRNTGNITPHGDGEKNIGALYHKFNTVYTTKLHNGEDIAIPTTGGTMALKEDIDAAVGDISTALTAILGE